MNVPSSVPSNVPSNVPTWEVREGDCRELLREVETGSVDMICTDPPYAISFMGRSWDKTLPDPAIWQECLRVLKPGGFAFVMSGARTDCLWRLCRDLNAAGFDLEYSMLHWVYRSGFPKALDVGKDFDRSAFVGWLRSPANGTGETRAEAMGWGPAEVRKAASAAVNGEFFVKSDGAMRRQKDPESTFGAYYEPMSMAPVHRSAGASLLAAVQARFGPAPGVRADQRLSHWGRIRGKPSHAGILDKSSTWDTMAPRNTAPATPLAQQWDGWKSPGLKPAWEAILVCQKPHRGPVRENVQRHGVGAWNVEACRVPFGATGPWASHVATGLAPGKFFTRGESTTIEKHSAPAGRYPANLLVSDAALGEQGSRYFDIDAWAEQHGLAEDGWAEAAEAGFVQVPKAAKGEKGAGNHPTVKPVRLMAYLIALACPPDGLVVDPFLGSGTTAVAAIRRGVRCLGMEIDPDYAAIARARCEHAAGQEAPPDDPRTEPLALPV